MQADNEIDCSHYEYVMNKQCVIKKLYFMLGRLINEGLRVAKTGDCCVCSGLLVCVCVRGKRR